MTRVTGTVRGFEAGEALVAFAAVKLSSGTVVYADAGEAPIGYTLETVSSGSRVTVEILRPTVECLSAGAFLQGATLYPANNGTVDDVANGDAIGIALTASTAAGDVVEVLPFIATSVAANQSTVETKTANYTVTAGDSGKTFSTAGASGTVTFAMPAATAGLKYRFRVGAAQELRIDPDGTETISLPSTGVPGAAGKYLTANAAGETVEIECVVAGTWSVFGYTGTWTAEA